MPKRLAHDPWLFVTAALLALGGLFMVGSASSYIAMELGQNPSSYLWKHLLHLLLGIIALAAAMSFPYHKLADGRIVVMLLVGCMVALILVLAMPEANGARRWYPIGPLKFQPSELAKLVAVLFVAFLLSRKEKRVNDLWAVPAPCFGVVFSLAFLVVIEPDLGSAVMLVAVPCVMVFVAGLSWKYIASAAGVGVVGFAASVIVEPYRLERIRSFLDPSLDATGAGFQLNQSLIALGTGGWTGAGLGHGHQKAFYLPAAHTDFIFSVIGEEFGLLGTGLLLLAFLMVFWRGMRAAYRAPDRFGFYLALGITNLLVLQAFINMCVCVGLLPTKGLPLPFISYGGSSLLLSMAATGLLLNVSQHSN
jgi:cell division protein FtsW